MVRNYSEAGIVKVENCLLLRVVPVGRIGAAEIAYSTFYFQFEWNFPATGWEVRQAGDTTRFENFSTWENLLDL